MGIPQPTKKSGHDLDETIRRAAQLDRDAFGLLYREFAPRIHRFIEYRTRQRELAEDLTNQVFMQALRAIGKYQHHSIPEFTGWLFRIARNAISDHWRRSRNTVSLDPDVHLKNHVESGDYAGQMAQSEELLNAIDQLTPEQMEVVALRFSQNMNHAQIAAILGKKETAVRALQFRAMTTLRAILATESGE